jgi:tyrosyl-tRNA synthetase
MNAERLLEDTAEAVKEKEIRDLAGRDPPPNSYWGVAPTGTPHLGYYRILEKQQMLVEEGFEHTILIADLHAYLDDEKCPWEEMERRSTVYEKCFELLGLGDAEFVRGSSFQRSLDYVDDLYHAIGKVTVNRAEHAASEVVRGSSPTLGSVTYPVMQNLDCVYLDSDLAVGGIDQRHVYMLGRELLPELGYEKVSFLFTPLGKSPAGEKMSASEKETKIELWADEDTIDERIHDAYCPEGELAENPVVDYVSHFVFPQLGEFTVERADEYGGDLSYASREDFEADYESGKLHPADLKPAAADAIHEALTPVREYFRDHPELLETFED